MFRFFYPVFRPVSPRLLPLLSLRSAPSRARGSAFDFSLSFFFFLFSIFPSLPSTAKRFYPTRRDDFVLRLIRQPSIGLDLGNSDIVASVFVFSCSNPPTPLNLTTTTTTATPFIFTSSPFLHSLSLPLSYLFLFLSLICFSLFSLTILWEIPVHSRHQFSHRL